MSVCSAHSNADTARTHPLRTRSTQREGSEGQTDRQSLRAVAVGLSRSTELRLPPPPHAASSPYRSSERWSPHFRSAAAAEPRRSVGG